MSKSQTSCSLSSATNFAFAVQVEFAWLGHLACMSCFKGSGQAISVPQWQFIFMSSFYTQNSKISVNVFWAWPVQNGYNFCSVKQVQERDGSYGRALTGVSLLFTTASLKASCFVFLHSKSLYKSTSSLSPMTFETELVVQG